MKLAIVGSRNYKNFEFVELKINEFMSDNIVTDIVSGGATGVDNLAEEYAKKYDIPIIIFEADWKKHGKSAGPIRNKLIVREADVIMAFPTDDSKGTMNTINLAKKENKKVIIYNV